MNSFSVMGRINWIDNHCPFTLTVSKALLPLSSWITSTMLGLCEWDYTHHSKGMKGNISRQPKWQCIYFSTIHLFTPAEDLALEAPFQSKKAKCLVTGQQTAHSWCHSTCSLQKQKYFGNTGEKNERTMVSYPIHWSTLPRIRWITKAL